MGLTESSLEELKAASGRPKKRIDALLREAASVDTVSDGKLSFRNYTQVLCYLILKVVF